MHSGEQHEAGGGCVLSHCVICVHVYHLAECLWVSPVTVVLIRLQQCKMGQREMIVLNLSQSKD